MPKEKPAHYVLVADTGTWVTTVREANKKNLTLLKKTARLVVERDTDAVVRIFYVPIDGDLSEANLLTDVEVASWRPKGE